MKDISYHILDIVQNSLNAGASTIHVGLCEDSSKHQLHLTIEDNGRGMAPAVLNNVTDPFFTSSLTKKVGLGLPLLKQNAELTGGSFRINSVEKKGTIVDVVFNNDHIDMIPVGDLAMTFRTLIATNAEKDFVYRHCMNEREFVLDTAAIKKELEGIPIHSREVLDYISSFIGENLGTLSV
jgi:hypothetical protein